MIIAYGRMRLDRSLAELREEGPLEEVFVREVEAAGPAAEEAE